MPQLPVALDAGGTSTVDITILAVSGEAVGSRSEARRLLAQGAIEVDGQRVTDQQVIVREGTVIRVGKRRFLRIVDADKQEKS
jgi:tyrosyl-tRNA synthetase